MKSLLILPLLALGPAVTASNARNVEIVGFDYAFKAPASLSPGRTTFSFRNAGKHRHEFNIFLLKRGVTIEDAIKARKEGKSQLSMIEGAVGVLFADAGTGAPARLTVDLLPGRDYGVQCIFQDKEGDPRHYDLGMYSVIRVGSGVKAPGNIRVDSVVAADYAYMRYPREVSPGIHTIGFRNAGKQRHELSLELLKKGVTLDSLMAVDKRDGDVEPLFEKNGGMGVLHSQGGQSALGSLEVNFLPGREYVIECAFQDDDKAPPHYKLGMYGSIKVKSSRQKTN